MSADKTNGDSTPENTGHDANEPDAPQPTGLMADVFDLAALVNTVKITFKMKEETALKSVELALNYRLTKESMALSSLPPAGAILQPAPPPEPE